MKGVVNCRFAIKNWEEKPYSEGAGLPKMTRAAVTKSFTGDIAGESHVEYLMMYRSDGSAAFVGHERIVGKVAGTRHMLDAIAEWNVLNQVERALDFVDGFLAPQAFRIADRKRRAAFSREMKIARRRRMDGMEREIISSEPRSQFVRLFGGAVIKMPARTEQLDGGSPRARRFAHECSGQLLVYKKICGENALHRHNVRALCLEMISTLCEALNYVKASPQRPNGEVKLNVILGVSRFSGRYSSSKNSASGGPGISPASTPRFRNS